MTLVPSVPSPTRRRRSRRSRTSRTRLDAAQRHGLRVMVGLSAEQYVGYLIDRKGAPDIEALIRGKVRSCAGHPALLCYALGNEIPAPLVRWVGPERIIRYLRRL